MRSILVSALLLITVFSNCQNIKRYSDESFDAFVARQKPENSIVVSEPLETFWNNIPIILAFYDQTYKLPPENDPDQTDYHRIIPTVFTKINEENYNRVLLDTIDNEGGDPEIETVFFANADTDSEKELIIISKWQQVHADLEGTLYGTYVFDDIKAGDQSKAVFIQAISQKLDGGCDCESTGGKHTKAKYKTEKDIKTQLIRMGFKQGQ